MEPLGVFQQHQVAWNARNVVVSNGEYGCDIVCQTLPAHQLAIETEPSMELELGSSSLPNTVFPVWAKTKIA